MGSAFSTFDHIGLVVRDLDRTIHYYESLGIGPFKKMDLGGLTNRTMNGKPTDFDMKVASAQIEPIGIELIQPVANCPLLEEFLKNKGEGINHICFLVKDFEKEAARLVKKGLKVVLTAKHATGGAVYLDTREVGGVIIELAQR